MTSLRLYTDEDIYGAVPGKLREAGLDVATTAEARRLGQFDRSQLEWAAQQRRVLLTFNVALFTQVHDDWSFRSLHHAGIIVSEQRPIGDLLRRLRALAKARGAEEMRDRLEYLGDW